jgi:hypothetical protein
MATANGSTGGWGWQDGSNFGRGGQDFLQFQTTCTAGDTFDPTVTLVTGCPYTPHWDLGNGDVADGAAVNYTGYVDAGPHTVTLVIPNIATWLKTIDFQGDKISGDFLTAVVHCRALTSLTAHGNPALSGDIAVLAGLPVLETIKLGDSTIVDGDIAALAGMSSLKSIGLSATRVMGDIGALAGMTQLTALDVHGNYNAGNITGDLADLEHLDNVGVLFIRATNVTGTLADVAAMAGVYYCDCNDVPTPGSPAISGSLTDLAPLAGGLLYFYAQGQDGITGGSLAANTGIRIVDVGDMGWDQATVDTVLLAIYNVRASYTYASTISLDIGAANAAPSGTYQNAVAPSTGKEYIYKLCNDPDAEGFKKWCIIYNNDGGGDVTRP